MISFTNGGLSNEVSYKRPLENGFMPKYKPRKVSAIRDFPPGCGPNAVPVNSRSEESFTGEVAGSREVLGAASSSIDVRLAMMFDKLIEKANENVGNGEKTIIHGLTDEVQEAMLEPDLVGVDIVKNIDTLDHSGSQLVVEELKEDHGVASFQNSSVEVDKSLGGPRESSAICGSIQHKDKYRPRRVSAVRDFPPQCGIYVSTLIEEEKRMATPELMPEPIMLTDVSEMEITSEMLRTFDECLDGLHNVRVEIEESETLDANAGRGLLGEMTVATAEGGVMEFEEYSRDLEHDITETNGASTGSYTMSKAMVNIRIEDARASVGKEIATFSPDRNDKDITPPSDFSSRNDLNRELVHGLIAAPLGSWRKSKAAISSPDGSKDDVDRKVVHGVRGKKETTISNSHGGTSGAKKRKHILFWQQKGNAVARKSKPEIKSPGLSSKKKKKVRMFNDIINGSGSLTLKDDGGHDGDSATTFSSSRNLKEYEINFPRFGPRFGPKNSSRGDDRNRVRETLRLFNVTCRKLLQLEEEEEANPTGGEEGRSKLQGRKGKNRIDLKAATALKRNKKYVNTTKRIGAVPGVEVGDEFQYRVELAVVGIHFPFQSGIDSMKVNELLLATSIVTSGAYNDDVENADVLRYSGQGGNVVGNSKSKQPEDQKLRGGNLALKNCIDTKTPVRVVRGWREMKYVDPLDSKPKLVTTYVYDGLYTVTDCFTEKGPHGKKVFMFDLRRNPGQPDLAWKELKKSSKCKTRLGVCVADISYGKERIPICAVNNIDNGKPPPFNYISKMMYPDWYHPVPPEGCNCVGRCSAMEKCACADRNGGAIPYNHNGALVETKTLVYECGPHCKCPPSCYNRATQRGIKFQLEIFKTEWRGWGVRALTSIPSGSFICEYAGELLEDKEAEKRIGNDEYLFDIGQNLQDSSPTNSDDDETVAEVKGGGFTVDALTYGNVGRFINHSCAPNLWAQNVIYDNKDKRMPHVMLFAMENIPPLQELTYCYNYSLGQIRDSAGNVKVKNCYCGAAGCTGRLY